MTNIIFAAVLWSNSITFMSKTRNAFPSRKVCVKPYWFGTVLVLLPVKRWEIASLAQRTSKRFFGWSRMRILCLTRVESSLVGSVRTESLCMPPLSSDTGSSFTINYSRLVGAVTFQALLQPRLFCVDFFFHGMAWHLTLFLSEVNVRLHNSGCVFSYVGYGFAYFYSFGVRWVRLLRTLCGFFILIRLWYSRCCSW